MCIVGRITMMGTTYLDCFLPFEFIPWFYTSHGVRNVQQFIVRGSDESNNSVE
jgi:hypothetical protein